MISSDVISAREELTVCEVTNLPYNMEINWQSISIYDYFVTSLNASYSCADINSKFDLRIYNNQPAPLNHQGGLVSRRMESGFLP